MNIKTGSKKNQAEWGDVNDNLNYILKKKNNHSKHYNRFITVFIWIAAIFNIIIFQFFLRNGYKFLKINGIVISYSNSVLSMFDKYYYWVIICPIILLTIINLYVKPLIRFINHSFIKLIIIMILIIIVEFSLVSFLYHNMINHSDITYYKNEFIFTQKDNAVSSVKASDLDYILFYCRKYSHKVEGRIDHAYNYHGISMDISKNGKRKCILNYTEDSNPVYLDNLNLVIKNLNDNYNFQSTYIAKQDINSSKLKCSKSIPPIFFLTLTSDEEYEVEESDESNKFVDERSDAVDYNDYTDYIEEKNLKTYYVKIPDPN